MTWHMIPRVMSQVDIDNTQHTMPPSRRKADPAAVARATPNTGKTTLYVLRPPVLV